MGLPYDDHAHKGNLPDAPGPVRRTPLPGEGQPGTRPRVFPGPAAAAVAAFSNPSSSKDQATNLAVARINSPSSSKDSSAVLPVARTLQQSFQ
ncbi:hypothetical protein ACLKA7_000094 [Drosophila subpalustris]